MNRTKQLTVLSPGSLANGRYRVAHFLAEGGMGTTWVGEDTQTKELVVIKEPRITGAAQTDRLNFDKLEVESYILKVLNHRNIVKFVDSFYLKNAPVLVTRLAEGDLLEKTAAGYPFDEKTAVASVGMLLDAVGYIHSQNVIHRDIRPKNILLDDGKQNLTLIDFGTAKFFYKQMDTPEAIISPGGYSPPEHYKLGYSPQGDIWSIGATLFYILTGQHPQLVLGAYPQSPQTPDPRKISPQVSDRMAQVVMTAMQVEPSRRYVNTLEMSLALEGRAPKLRTNPAISLRNFEIPIKTGRVIIGRNVEFDPLLEVETVKESSVNLSLLEERPTVEESPQKTSVWIVDPGHYISRLHAEVFEREGGWYVKDLGSLNGTAVLTDAGWQPIGLGPKKEGPDYPLTGKDIISLGYNARRGPYLIVTFLAA